MVRVKRFVSATSEPGESKSKLAEAQRAAEAAAQKSAETRGELEAAQRLWLDAVAAGPGHHAHPPAAAAAVKPSGPLGLLDLLKHGLTWGALLSITLIVMCLALAIFLTTWNVATSDVVRATLDPLNPRLGGFGFAPSLPVPAGLKRFEIHRPVNFFDVLESLGVLSVPLALVRPPT
jgi:hypothetical protein